MESPPVKSLTADQAPASPASAVAPAALEPTAAASKEIGADAELRRIRAALPQIFDGAALAVAGGELPLIGWGLSKPRVQKLSSSEQWFFVGDIHGDFLAWHRLLTKVREREGFRLCFLGDLVDRGPFSLECFASILEVSMLHPGQILWILGNHDEALGWNDKEKRFFSKVEPSEFADFLNEPHAGLATAEQLVKWGNLFMDVASRLPRAILYEDGLLATHGGVPLGDQWADLKTLEAFHHPRCLGDFTWTRATEVPKKLGWKFDPIRRAKSSSFEFGYKDLEGFAQASAAVLPVKRVVRGHDHVENGHHCPSCYKAVPLLTVNGFGFNYLSNSVHQYRSSLLFGIGRADNLPEIKEVTFGHDEYLEIYPAEPAQSPESPVHDNEHKQPEKPPMDS